MTSWICANGHLATTRELASRGVTDRAMSAAVRAGRLLRLKQGTYACPHLEDDLQMAARAGVRIDCVTALARVENRWSGVEPPGLHVRARSGRHLGPLPPDAVVHWSDTESGRGVVSPIEALAQAARCLPVVDWLACVESALHLGSIDEQDLVLLAAAVPRRTATVLGRLDRGAQSGLETHLREKLRSAGHRTRSQVEIPGAGPIDLLVDGLVGVEADGAKWHAERFLRDRTKDIRVRAWGIPVLRLGKPHVFELWDETLDVIELMIDDARRVRSHGS